MGGSGTFWWQRYACCVELLLAGVQTVSQRIFTAWGGRTGRGDNQPISTRQARRQVHANAQQQQQKNNNFSTMQQLHVMITCSETKVNTCCAASDSRVSAFESGSPAEMLGGAKILSIMMPRGSAETYISSFIS